MAIQQKATSPLTKKKDIRTFSIILTQKYILYIKTNDINMNVIFLINYLKKLRRQYYYN